jgi:hypothetical protein
MINEELYNALGEGVRDVVKILMDANVETFESCQGGEGHAYPEPTVRFHGERSEGFRALAVVMQAGIRVLHLRRLWRIDDGEPTGPWWEIVIFPHKGPIRSFLVSRELVFPRPLLRRPALLMQFVVP